MDEYEAEDSAVEAARGEPGFDEGSFRAAFRVGYAAGHSAVYAEGRADGIDRG